ncbi:ATP-binding cassette domain-containing protein [Fusobacterium necrophorum]|uniref:ABC transporter ATP-binding protein/permease n=1 Tax=Fusobacterium necrophorum TaxID=859 RepID=UPI00254AB1B8|nr:ATP-binding cassette domain-containing protein [Fusobacterium necrophorum]MDK4500998.1 ATP-binding cassette domain-containing protein [Fusobacterium necrophorum]
MFINRALIKFAQGTEKKIIQAVLFQLLTTFILSAIALCMSFLIKQLIVNGQIIRITTIVLILIIFSLYLALKILSKINVKIVINAGVSIKDNVRTQIMQQLFLLGPAFVNTMRTGFLTSTFTTRVEWLMNYYTKYMPVVLSAIINAAVFIVFLTYIDLYTGLVALISVLIMLFIPMCFFNMMKEKGKQEWNNHAKYYSECLDGIQGMISLKAFNADKKYVKDIKECGEDYRKSIMEHLRVTIIEGTFLEFFVRVGTAITIAILGWRCAYGYVDEEWLIIAFFSIGATFSPMITLISAWHLGFQGVSGSYSINEFLQIESENIISNQIIPNKRMLRDGLTEYMENGEKGKNLNILEKDFNLLFNEVSFKYPKSEKNAVEEISFELKKGKIIAFIGNSGSGKSTIASLIAGFYRPQKGDIFLNGTKLDNETLGFFHNNISAVWQDNHLFSGTIYENIKMGNWSAGKEEIYRASKDAMIHELIMTLPDKYNTKVDELSSKFSMGERQRIAIARAILKNTPIIIFDEATSSLDRKNEIYIQRMMEGLKEKKAIFIIAHRLSTILMADEICIMEKGRIVERGNHQDLLQSSQIYNDLVGGML